eukprot:GHVS01074342.1.p1 GENE.GHVS01074342.1~~GHVS01074342.1.p1  ORF type:complete len:401 (-),score=53.95 GHVS01074342.1:131-1333(-)
MRGGNVDIFLILLVGGCFLFRNMATEKSGFRTATDANLNTHEAGEFPVLCETCLGDSPYVRMTREPSGKECKICNRPYAVFRWKPGPKARFKQTIICQTCAKLKNVCQTCLFDLEYGLPVQVRDRYLADQAQKLDLPESHVNRNYLANQLDKMAESKALPYGKAPAPNPILERLARHSPYYRRNRPRVCSFWQRGACSRGPSCPFLHEEEEHDPALSKQNIKDRYVGQDDPVADKIVRRAETTSRMHPPEDRSIMTLFVGNLTDPEITETDIRSQFYTFGDIRSIKVSPRQSCAFVTYTTRKAAEEAMEALQGQLTVRGCAARLLWGRQQLGGVAAALGPHDEQYEYSEDTHDVLAAAAANYSPPTAAPPVPPNPSYANFIPPPPPLTKGFPPPPPPPPV